MSFKLINVRFFNDTNSDEPPVIYKASDVFDGNFKQKPKDSFKTDSILQYFTIEITPNSDKNKYPDIKIFADELGPFQYIECDLPPHSNTPQANVNEFDLDILIADRNDVKYFNFPELKPISVEDTTPPEKLVSIINRLQETVSVLCNRVLDLEDYINANLPADDDADYEYDETAEYSTWRPPNSSSSNNTPPQQIFTNPTTQTNPFALFASTSAPSSQNSNTNSSHSYFPGGGNNSINYNSNNNNNTYYQSQSHGGNRSGRK